MTRALALLIAVSLAVSVAACGSNRKPNPCTYMTTFNGIVWQSMDRPDGFEVEVGGEAMTCQDGEPVAGG